MARAKSKGSVKAADSKALAREHVEPLIHEIRGEKVILDSDLARLYGVTAKRLNEQVKRNRERFPTDFVFQLTAKESAASRSQFATSSRKHRGIVYRPCAFTEHGAIMAANVPNSPRAVQMSVFVVRAFLKMRAFLGDKRELANNSPRWKRNSNNGSTFTKPPSSLSRAAVLASPVVPDELKAML